MSKIMLQLVSAIIAIMTIGLGGATVLFGIENPMYASAELPDSVVLDSNLRFFGGVCAGLGLLLLWLTPAIEKRGVVFRAVWLCALLGGLGRIVSMAETGMPPAPMIVFTAIEVPLVPVFVYWQYHISRFSD